LIWFDLYDEKHNKNLEHICHSSKGYIQFDIRGAVGVQQCLEN